MLTRTRPAPRRLLVLIAALSMALATLVVGPAAAQDSSRSAGEFTLTVLHNNDSESQLIDAGEGALVDFGGVARFASVVARERSQARSDGRSVVLLSSGDNYLPGPEFTASLELDEGEPFFDALALDYMRYDAVILGNHDFDLGPDVLADFITGFRKATRTPFLSANLDFSGEPRLQALVDARAIAPAATIKVDGQTLGVIGATTPTLPFISSPRNVVVDDDVAGRVQEQVDRFTARGVNKIIVVTHLQDVQEEIELASHLSDVDVIIAGGGAELLANPGDPLVPGDTIYGPYPLLAEDADGTTVPVVTTNGDYRYLGRLDVTFDAEGNVTEFGGRPIRVAASSQPGGVAPNSFLQSAIVEPVVEFLEELATNVIATSQVALEGRANPGVRSEETNLGSLLTDSILWQSNLLADTYGVPQGQVAFQNGGGIRNASLIPAGPITELTTFDVAPFPNFLAMVPDVPRETIKRILENGYSEIGGGRFTQVSGLTVTYSLSGTPMEIATDGTIITEGTRVRSVVLDDGSVIVEDGAVVAGPPITVATIDFLAAGGDQYPFGGLPYVPLGATYQQGLSNFIEDGLDGLISAADYPEGGSGRIIQIP